MATETAVADAGSSSEIIRLLQEQKDLLRELVANAHSIPSFPDPQISEAKAIAARVSPTEEVRFVAVDTETGRYATGRTVFEAAQALGTLPERTLTIRAGGGAVRLRSPGRLTA